MGDSDDCFISECFLWGVLCCAFLNCVLHLMRETFTKHLIAPPDTTQPISLSHGMMDPSLHFRSLTVEIGLISGRTVSLQTHEDLGLGSKVLVHRV